MGVARRRLLLNLAGSLCVVLALGGLAYGLPAVDRALPARRPVSSAEPYPVGGGVSVVPPPGALVDVTQTRPGADGGTALFVIGAVHYLVVVTPFDGELSDAASRLRRRITDTRGYRVVGAELRISTHSGLDGVQGGYTAPGRGGRYAVFLVDGRAIEVTVSGDDGELLQALEAIEASTHSLRYRGDG